jgi:hypothetical protein
MPRRLRLPWWLQRCYWRHRLCELNLHRVVWSDYAYPGSSDPPEPPEPGWCCEYCCEVRLPYRAIFWYRPVWFIEWRCRRD